MVQPGDGVSVDQSASWRPATILSRSSCSAVRSSQISLTRTCCHTRSSAKRRAEGTRPSAPLLRVSTRKSTTHFFLAAAFFAGDFLVAAFFAGADFFAGDAFFAAAFFAGAFAAAFLAGAAFFAAAFLAGAFLAAAFLAGAAFLAEAFLAATCCSFFRFVFLLGCYYLLLSAALSVLLAVNFIRVAAAMFTAAPV